ncbi:MAG: hypothetical protein ACRDPA_10670 [Solirubrobacteraceae bacterium]
MRMRALAGVVLVAGLTAAGCGSSSSGSGSSQVPTVALTRAADVSSAAAGYKVALTLHESIPNAGAIVASGTGSFSPAAHEGAMSMQMSLPPGAGLSTLALQMVLDKGSIYMKFPPALASKLPGGKPWVYINLAQAGKAAGISGLGSLLNSSSSFSNPGQYLNFLRATTNGSVQDLGPATVNGVSTTHYHAKVDLTKLPQAVPASQRKAMQQLMNSLRSKAAVSEIPMDVWIDSSHLVRRVRSNFTETVNSQSLTIAMTENFLSYGAQPAPVVPPSSQTENLLSLLHSAAGASSGTSTGA